MRKVMQYMADELAQKWVLKSILDAGGFLTGTGAFLATYAPAA